ncbi:MAG: 50S ribosomal protein L18 [Odoribacter sp.]|nr:50S ribosomal protein L18 [Odoribacter sp.]
MISKIDRRNKIKARIRGRISGTATRPRMTVFRSNKQIYVQLVDDLAGKTLVSTSSKGIGEGTKIEIAAKVGEAIAKKALEAGITEVVFDRNGYLFHGRVKSLADAARQGGLKF